MISHDISMITCIPLSIDNDIMMMSPDDSVVSYMGSILEIGTSDRMTITILSIEQLDFSCSHASKTCRWDRKQ